MACGATWQECHYGVKMVYQRQPAQSGDVAFDELGDILDSMIETGGMTKEEYQAKVKDFVCSL